MQPDASGTLQVDTLVPPPHGSREPEATALAREIEHLIHSTPPAATNDSRLIALLSNPSFMNGSFRKPSIWNILENINRTSSPNSNPVSSPTHVGSDTHPLKGDEPTSPNIYPNQLSNESLSSVAFSDTSSIMVYSPLFPTQSDIVELAELVPYDTDSGEVEEQDTAVNSGDSGDRARTQEEVVGRPSWTLKWPFSRWYRQRTSQTLSPSDGPQQQPAEPITPQVGTNNADTNLPPARKSQKNTRAWVPSSSKFSFQVFWWGYRMYLPPPIIEILSDKTLETTKRADLISAALAWFFDNIPISVLPPPLKQFLMFFQLLVPLIGSIGTLISWSWLWITSYDVGHGVTLTATWILPLALIPGTWHETDFPKSPLPSSPIPLPQYRPFSMQSSEPPTPAMSTTTMTEDDTPTSAFATPMSSVISLRPDPDALDENRMVDLSLASSSTTWSASPPPPQLPPQHLPISPLIHYGTTILPNSPNSLCFTPISLTTTPVAHNYLQPLPSTSTSSVPFTYNPSTTLPSPLPSPRVRKPRFSTRMGGGSFSPSISSINNGSISPQLMVTHRPSPITTTPTISTSTPIPMPPTPIDLPPIPPEFPLCPNLVNELLRGPALQTVPLPEVE